MRLSHDKIAHIGNWRLNEQVQKYGPDESAEEVDKEYISLQGVVLTTIEWLVIQQYAQLPISPTAAQLTKCSNVSGTVWRIWCSVIQLTSGFRR